MTIPGTTTSIRVTAEQARDLFHYQKREDGTGFYSFDFDRLGRD